MRLLVFISVLLFLAALSSEHALSSEEASPKGKRPHANKADPRKAISFLWWDGKVVKDVTRAKRVMIYTDAGHKRKRSPQAIRLQVQVQGDVFYASHSSSMPSQYGVKTTQPALRLSLDFVAQTGLLQVALIGVWQQPWRYRCKKFGMRYVDGEALTLDFRAKRPGRH